MKCQFYTWVSGVGRDDSYKASCILEEAHGGNHTTGPYQERGGAWYPHATQIKIVLNGREYLSELEELSYDAIVNIVSDRNTTSLYTVVWSVGRPVHKGGSLIPGQRLKLESGMTITAVITDNA